MSTIEFRMFESVGKPVSTRILDKSETWSHPAAHVASFLLHSSFKGSGGFVLVVSWKPQPVVSLIVIICSLCAQNLHLSLSTDCLTSPPPLLTSDESEPPPAPRHDVTVRDAGVAAGVTDDAGELAMTDSDASGRLLKRRDARDVG